MSIYAFISSGKYWWLKLLSCNCLKTVEHSDKKKNKKHRQCHLSVSTTICTSHPQTSHASQPWFSTIGKLETPMPLRCETPPMDEFDFRFLDLIFLEIVQEFSTLSTNPFFLPPVFHRYQTCIMVWRLSTPSLGPTLYCLEVLFQTNSLYLSTQSWHLFLREPELVTSGSYKWMFKSTINCQT